MTGRVLALAVVLVTAVLLQTVVVPAVAVAGYAPDLVVLTVVAFARCAGPTTGARYGFAAGIALDLLSGSALPVGVTALVLLVVGYLVGALRPYLAETGLGGEMALVAAASISVVLLHGLLGLLLESASGGGLVAVSRTAVAVGAYNALLTPLLLGPLNTLWRWTAPLTSVSTRLP